MKIGLSLLVIAIVALILAFSPLRKNVSSPIAEQFSPVEGISCVTEGKDGLVTVRGVDSRTSPQASETYTRDGKKITHQVVLRAVAHEYCMNMITRYIAAKPDTL